MGQRADSAKITLMVSQQQDVIKAAQAQTEQLEKEIEARDQAANTQIAALQKQVESLKTPSDLASFLQGALNKSVPAPIVVQAPSSDPAKPVQVTVPQPDLKPLADLINKAQSNSVLLSTCQADLTDKDTQLKAAGLTQQALITENAKLKKAANPPWYKKVGHVAKLVGIGVGVGFVLGGIH